jgi:hypothetical protein
MHLIGCGVPVLLQSKIQQVEQNGAESWRETPQFTSLLANATFTGKKIRQSFPLEPGLKDLGSVVS